VYLVDVLNVEICTVQEHTIRVSCSL